MGDFKLSATLRGHEDDVGTRYMLSRALQYHANAVRL